MHSHIVQIENHPVTEDERMREDVFYDYLGDIPADYVDEIDKEDEEEFVNDTLPRLLPQSMFKCEGREITFLGGDVSWMEDWQNKIREELAKGNPSKLVKGGLPFLYLYKVKKAVTNALDIDTRFYCNEDGYCQESTEFIFDRLHLEPGTKLYVGAVIDYHY